MSYSSNSRRKQQGGSAMMVVMIGIALLSLGVTAALLVNNRTSLSANRAQQQEGAAAFVQSMGTILADSTVCLQGLGGTSTNLKGLTFIKDDGSPGFNLALAQRPNKGQLVRISTNLTAPGTQWTETGSDLPSLGLHVDRLYLGSVSGTGPLYKGQIYARLSSLGENDTTTPMRDRLIAPINFTVDPTGKVTACNTDSVVLTPQSLCEHMGCSYDNSPSNQGQKCLCPLPSVSCPSQQYITGLKPDFTPICKPIGFTCPPGQYIEAFSPTGVPYCATVQTIAGVTPPPPTPAPSVIPTISIPPITLSGATQTWVVVGGCSNKYSNRPCFKNTYVTTGTLKGSKTCSAATIIGKGYTKQVTGSPNSYNNTLNAGTPCTLGDKAYWISPTIPNQDPDCINDYLALECQKVCTGFFCF